MNDGHWNDIVRAIIILMVCMALTFILPCALMADSLYHELPVVEVASNFREVSLRSVNSEAIISASILEKQAPNNLLSAVNLIPGVRMEERSPGSYRFSIRGSLLRSPFGVRNVKFYLSDWPLTDASGNTYLNSLDISGIHAVRVIKGPSSGILGANTGGIVVIDPFQKPDDSLQASLSMTGGSYGLVHQHASYSHQWKNAFVSLNQSFQRSDGYRDHAAMYRAFVQGTSRWRYKEDAILKGMFFYSNLNYETPGGLTLQQVEDNPRASRPATQTLPGAAEQRAGVVNQTGFAGLTHHRKWKERYGHSASIWGSYTDFQNPFITNYEHRKEGTYGLRTYVDAETNKDKFWWLKGTLGGEWQQTYSNIKNFGNNRGEKDTIQVADQLRAQQAFVFTRLQIDFFKKLLIESSLSINFFDLRYKGIYPVEEYDWNMRSFRPQVMPRLSVNYTPVPLMSLRGIISRGFSVPTLAEIRASDNLVNTNLQAEKGINYEAGIRIRNKRDIFWVDAAFFWYRLRDAIVRQLDEQGNESFVNAGGTNQPGVEVSLQLHPVQNGTKWLSDLSLQTNYSWNKFRFDDYRIGDNDFSGNWLTGNPRHTCSGVIDAGFAGNIGLYVQYYYASSIPLNDANTVFDDAYHILQVKLDWKRSLRKCALRLFVGVDNLLNQQYSLGNDLNAFGGRFFNPAPGRNYYGGLKVAWGK
jgi:iron complex outermembrane receptor protein